MHKFHFLCTHHRRWLQDNPEAVAVTWLQSYTRSLDLSEEHNYKEAANHAGAAFETAEIALSHGLGSTQGQRDGLSLCHAATRNSEG